MCFCSEALDLIFTSYHIITAGYRTNNAFLLLFLAASTEQCRIHSSSFALLGQSLLARYNDTNLDRQSLLLSWVRAGQVDFLVV
jgi:hypothetical protein